MKVTPDTNFFISATQWENSVSHKLLLKFIEKDVEMFTTSKILEEFAKVLSRDFKYNKEEIENILSSIVPSINIVKPLDKVNVVLEDPDDNKIIECALASQSDFIITYDNHLLKLKKYNEIKMITPEIAFSYL